MEMTVIITCTILVLGFVGLGFGLLARRHRNQHKRIVQLAQDHAELRKQVADGFDHMTVFVQFVTKHITHINDSLYPGAQPIDEETIH